MKNYNTSEILVLAHKEAKAIWRESIKGTRNKNRSFGKTYRQVLSVCLKNNWDKAKYNAEKTETFILSLSYNDTKKRDYAKRLGAKWNVESKTWTISCKKSDLSILSDNVVSEILSTKKEVNTSGKTEWLVNGKKTYNNLSYGEMWNRYGTDFE